MHNHLCRIKLWVAVRFRQECYVRWSNIQNRYFREKGLVQGEGIMKPKMEMIGYYEEKGKNKRTK